VGEIKEEAILGKKNPELFQFEMKNEYKYYSKIKI